jgi:phage tail sheath protein FI
MATAYTTPGVYIEEISKLPPSIVPVATAIPAFIGLTASGENRKLKPTEIRSLVEYEVIFGTAQTIDIRVGVSGPEGQTPVVEIIDEIPLPSNHLYFAMRHYFANGGGRCFVVSVDTFDAESETEQQITTGDVDKALRALEACDEPTLIVCPEAAVTTNATAASLATLILGHCDKMKDRFAILDVPNAHPDGFDEADEGTEGNEGDDVVDWFRGTNDTAGVTGDPTTLAYGGAYFPFLETDIPLLTEEDRITIVKTDGLSEAEIDAAEGTPVSDESYAASAVGEAARRLVRERAVCMLPPSAAIAGAIVRTDSKRGVWKAPANVVVKGVRRPAIEVTAEEQGELNVDATSGKSINVIRSFTGRGNLIWGARTLNGNSNEFRYVNVRRYFNFVEESTKKATAHFMFEPNDKNTWVKVKSMIVSFLTKEWRQGALAGATPDDAFYVNVGLGETMTTDDVLNGRLIVEIGLAVVRPAEFIVLKFSHKLQTS